MKVGETITVPLYRYRFGTEWEKFFKVYYNLEEHKNLEKWTVDITLLGFLTQEEIEERRYEQYNIPRHEENLVIIAEKMRKL